MRRGRRERIYPFREPGASYGMHECIPYKVGKRVRFIEGLVRRMQCVQSVGAYRYNQAQANPSPGTRAVEDACPYKRNRAVWFLWVRRSLIIYALTAE